MWNIQYFVVVQLIVLLKANELQRNVRKGLEMDKV